MTYLFDMFGYGFAAAASAAETVADYKGDQDGGAAFPPFDPTYFPSQIFWLLVTFFVLYFMLSRIFLPRIGSMIEERSNRIADDLDMASRLQLQAEQAQSSYEQELADARAKAHNIGATTRASVEAEIAKDVEAADVEADRQQAGADARIATIRNQALKNIDKVAADVAAEIVEKIGGFTPNTATVKTAVG
ncbi:F0F1 ATP synthase subunit B family protein [Robiginitomaculum antarcticum]|uniref:F0F1 ATP synthase subunit B family protein n=1 Tax=Robiginitomaculum antarcticum TaxID=437507 RepID=UPI000371500A|nr:hypothetical protein [Robiginitomaculum antarcticum]